MWVKVLAALQDESSLHELLVDSTAVQAHQHAAGALKKTGAGARTLAGRAKQQAAPELRRPRPARQVALMGRQAGDYPQAPALLAPDLRAGQWVLADRVYDADYVRQQVAQAGTKAVIISKKIRKQVLGHDPEIYKRRNQIERCINRFKAYCGLATRFEKTASAYVALVTLATIHM